MTRLRSALEVAEVGEQPLERVAALEERLELPGRVPRRVAVDAHVAVVLGADEDVEALAAGVLLDVRLERLQRRVQRRPLARRGTTTSVQRRVGDERERRDGHQKICP